MIYPIEDHIFMQLVTSRLTSKIKTQTIRTEKKKQVQKKKKKNNTEINNNAENIKERQSSNQILKDTHARETIMNGRHKKSSSPTG